MEFERHGKEVTLAEKRKDLERGRAEVQSLSEQIAQLESLLAKRDEERETIAEQYEQAGEQIVEARRKSEELVVQVEAMDGEIARAREARAALADLRAHQEEKLNEIDSRRTALDDRKVESESERVRLNLQKEDLARRFKHEFEKEYSDWTSIDRQPDRPQKELEDVANELRNRIQRLGPVNRLAKQEFDEVNERFEFLSTQKDDLEKARANLMRTIGEIKRTARERFETVFVQIQENFRKTFRTMFGGGKADLILLDQEDIIEWASRLWLSLLARPAEHFPDVGRREALTAISLIFADLPDQAQPLLHSGRNRRAAGRREHRTLYARAEAIHRPQPVSHHYAQQAHHGNLGRDLWRDHGAAGRQPDHVDEFR